MKILIILAWRNLWRNRKRTLITISSVLFAVLLAISFFSMEQGAYERMIDSMVRYSTGYIQIQDVLYEEEPSIDNSMLFDEEIKLLLEEFETEISFYAPRIQSFALVATENITRGSMVSGIDPERESRLNDLEENLISGEYLATGDKGILIAEGLAGILNVGIADTLVLLGQGFHGATAAGKYPVQGIVDLRIPEMNNNTIYMSLDAAQWFYMADNRLTSLIIMPEDPDHTRQLANELGKRIDSEWYRVLTWEEMLEDLLALMKFDMAGTWILMIILYIVITFGLFGTILMMMIERQREFGLLFSLGMKRSRVAVMCFIESLIISVSGVIAGITAAIPVILYFYYNPIRLTGDMADAMADYGFEPIMPFSTDPLVFYTQAQIVLIISILIGLFPVYKVLRLEITSTKK